MAEITSNDPLEKRALEIADKLYKKYAAMPEIVRDEIAQALREYAEEAVFEANKKTLERERNLQAIAVKLALLEGAEQMRERAAKIVAEYGHKAGLSEERWLTPNVLASVSEQIRSLPLTESKTNLPEQGAKCNCLCHLQGYVSSCPNCRDRHKANVEAK